MALPGGALLVARCNLPLLNCLAWLHEHAVDRLPLGGVRWVAPAIAGQLARCEGLTQPHASPDTDDAARRPATLGDALARAAGAADDEPPVDHTQAVITPAVRRGSLITPCYAFYSVRST